jgi:hypothetical protein
MACEGKMFAKTNAVNIYALRNASFVMTKAIETILDCM